MAAARCEREAAMNSSASMPRSVITYTRRLGPASAVCHEELTRPASSMARRRRYMLPASIQTKSPMSALIWSTKL